MSRPFLHACCLVAIAAGATAAAAAPYVIVAGAPSHIEFQSKAPMETFTGKTDQVRGSIDIDPAAIGDAISVQVEVEMASLDTGIALRNKHMMENHLHADRFPQAVFTGGTLTDVSSRELPVGGKVTGVIQGEMELHGVKKPLAARFELTRGAGHLRVVAHFVVTLSDFGIPRPQFLLMKLGETQVVVVDIVAKPK
jgi:polyisoprenoid-binding protein YceI